MSTEFYTISEVHALCLLQLMFVDQRKERTELLRELLRSGAGIDPLPALTQVS